MKPVFVNASGDPVSETEAVRDGVLLSGYEMLTPLVMKDGSSVRDAQADAYARSVHDMNAWRGGVHASAPVSAEGAFSPVHDSHRVTDADMARAEAECDAAYERSIVDQNAWRNRV